MAVLDISVVGLVLPVLSHELGAPLPTLAWVVLAYVLAITGLLLAFGRLADRVGRRRVYAGGLLLFVASSAGCAAAPGVPWLIAARALQGVGAAMMSANSSALLVAAFPASERGRALGAFGASVGFGLAIGPPIGGWIVHALSWHWIFLINLPIGVIAFALLLAQVPGDRRSPSAGEDVEPSPAPLSAATWSIGLVLVMLALSFASEHQAGPRSVAIAAAGGLAAFGLFVVSERRAANPLLPWNELRGPLGRALFLTLLGQALSMSLAFLLPLQLEVVAGFDPGRAGRWLAITPLAALFFAPLAGRWADRVGSRLLATLGLVVTAAGAIALSRLGTANHGLVLGAALFGVGLGLFTAPNASAVMGAVDPSRLGVAAGLQATARNLGIAAGTAAASAAVALLYAAFAGAPLVAASVRAGNEASLARAIGLSFAAAAVVAGVGAGVAALGPGDGHGAHTST